MGIKLQVAHRLVIPIEQIRPDPMDGPHLVHFKLTLEDRDSIINGGHFLVAEGSRAQMGLFVRILRRVANEAEELTKEMSE